MTVKKPQGFTEKTTKEFLGKGKNKWGPKGVRKK